jgi:hypothetical protein
MCPIHQPQPGAICLISSNGDGVSLAAIFFAVTPPPTVETLTITNVFREPAAQQTTRYLDPTLDSLTPPPEA